MYNFYTVISEFSSPEASSQHETVVVSTSLSDAIDEVKNTYPAKAWLYMRFKASSKEFPGFDIQITKSN